MTRRPLSHTHMHSFRVFVRSKMMPLITFCLISWINFACGTSSSLMKRIQDRQEIPPSIQDVLMSIDDKLRNLDTFSYTLKLARLDFSLDQLVRKMENIESKLGRLETKFDLRMDKVEEIVASKEKYPIEHLSRKLENLNERINNKAAYLDAKLDIKLERIMSKLELLERDLHNSVDDVLERLVKGEEKCRFAENEITKQDEKLEAAIREIKSLVRGELTSTVVHNFTSLTSEISGIKNFMQIKENASEKTWSDIQASLSGAKERVLVLLQDGNDKIDNLSATLIQGNHRSRIAAIDLCSKTVISEQLGNLTAKLERALTVGEAKFKELDSDVEQYTKKVINGIQELWKTSDELKVDLSLTLEQGSKTREMVRKEFQQIHEQIEPLPKLEPKLSEISEDIDKKVVQLSATVDNSFATLLVAQNTFIDSCKRIQQEEMHVYDILQQIVYEMRNRSISDVHRISTELQQQSLQINKSISHVLAAVSMTGNITRNALKDLMKNKERCLGNINWNAVEKLCSQVPQNYSTHSSKELKDSSEMMYDSESDPINDSAINLNEYEDYHLSEIYYPDNF